MWFSSSYQSNDVFEKKKNSMGKNEIKKKRIKPTEILSSRPESSEGFSRSFWTRKGVLRAQIQVVNPILTRTNVTRNLKFFENITSLKIPRDCPNQIIMSSDHPNLEIPENSFLEKDII